MEHKLEELRLIQKETARGVLVEDGFEAPIITVGGVDLAFSREDGIVACVVMDYPPTTVYETQALTLPLNFPYVSTFLAFREGPAVLRIMSSMKTSVSIFLINGQGIAHPLRCGLASHVGVLSGRPTIGVTVGCLVGEHDREPGKAGDAVPLTYEGDMVGWVLKSLPGSRPIFVSPGHMVGLESSLSVVRACLLGHKLPEPLYLAHTTANIEKSRLGLRKS